MTLVYIDVISRCDLPAGSCDDVSLCLAPAWSDKTNSGLAIASAKITRVSKYIPQYTVDTSCCQNVSGCATECIYQLQVDDSQFKTDSGTGLAYVIHADDVVEINPYACHMAKYQDFIINQSDNHVDADTSEIVQDSDANTSTFTMPVTNEAGDVAETVVLALPGGSLTNPSAEVLRYTSNAGKNFDLDVTDLIEDSFDNITLTRTGTGGKFEVNIPALTPGFTSIANAPSGAARTQYDDGTVINQGPNTLAVNDTVTSPSINTAGPIQSVSIAAGNVWTQNRIAEHGSLAVDYFLTNRVFSDLTAVNTLKTGNHAIKTPAYEERSVQNPSDRRKMAITITITGAYYASNTTGSGMIVWGHNVWIDGVVVSNRNGRYNDSFNINKTTHSGAGEVFTLPTIVIARVLNPLQTMVIGVDFGDNETFPSVGTTTGLIVQSRQIVIMGSTGTT